MSTKASILIVDDNPGLRKSLSGILRARGYAPTGAATGKTALDRVEEEMPVVALIDLKLEDMSGLGVMEKIKERSPDTECIVLTGYATQASAIEAVNLGAYGYVQKPYEIEQLLVTIRRAIEKREAQEALREYRQMIERLHGEARRLAACKEEEEVYQIAVRAAEQILHFSICTLDIVGMRIRDGISDQFLMPRTASPGHGRPNSVWHVIARNGFCDEAICSPWRRGSSP